MSVLSVSECIKAGYSSIVIQTAEENRAIAECLKAGIECEKKMFCWSCTKGIERVLEETREDSEGDYYLENEKEDLTDPQDALEESLKLNNGKGNYIFCFLDFQHYLNRPDVKVKKI